MLDAVPERPARPGVADGRRLLQQPELPFQVGIQQTAGEAARPQRRRQARNAGRRFTRFGDWRDDEEDVANRSSHCPRSRR